VCVILTWKNANLEVAVDILKCWILLKQLGMIDSNKAMEGKMIKPLEGGLRGNNKEIVIVSLQIWGWFLSQSERTVLTC
jgi:hypothetical protein